MVAVFPMLWLNLFSHDPDVLNTGASYLRIVAPAYGALGFGFEGACTVTSAITRVTDYLGD